MRWGKLFLSLFTAALLTLAVLTWTQEQPDAGEKLNTRQPFSVRISSFAHTERINCWESEPGQWYVFLPGYASPEETVLSLEQGEPVFLDGIPLTEGMSCGSLEWNRAYTLGWGQEQGSITFLHAGNVPALYIDLASGSLAHIHADKEHTESGKLRLYDGQGLLDYGGSLEAVSGRGNSTWEQAKKPYNLKLSSQADLLGMGAAKKWILLANITDRSHLRNKMVLDFADSAGLAYTPQSRWVELYMNGDYLGLYQLCERNEIHPQRIREPEDSSFLVSIEVQRRLEKQSYPHFVTQSNTALRVHHGEASLELLRQKWQSLENALLAEDGIDPKTGIHYLDLIDLDSWVRKFLVEEMFGNGDAGALSQFFYGGITEGRIYAGPMWDYDVSMGLGIWQMRIPNAFYANRPYLRKGIEVNWFHALYQKAEFYDRLRQLYAGEFRPMMEALLETGMESCARQIQAAADRNQVRWPGTSAEEETARIRSYLKARMAFLDEIWLEGREYCLVTVDKANGENALCQVIEPGQTVAFLPEYEQSEDCLGWYDLGRDIPFDPTQPIYEDMIISLKWKDSAYFPEDPQQEAATDLSLRKAVPFGILGLGLLGLLACETVRSRKRKR